MHVLYGTYLQDIHQEEYVETVKHPSSKSEASEEELAANGKISDGAAGQTPLSNLKSSAEITVCMASRLLYQLLESIICVQHVV